MRKFQRELGSMILLTLLVSNVFFAASIAFGLTLYRGNNMLLLNSRLDSVLQDALNSQDANTPTRVIVTFKDGSDSALASETIKAKIGGSYRELYEYSIISAVSGELPLGRVPEIAELPFVQKIYHDSIYWVPEPADTIESTQIQAIYDTGLDAIGAPYVHSQGYLGQGIRIAILDTGINDTHPDLDAGKVVIARSFATDELEITDLNGHGTHVAGIAAGTGEASSYLYKGVAPEALLVDAKCINAAGFGYSSDIIAAIQWSVLTAGADILSMSIGGGTPDPDDPLSVAVDNAVAQGVVVVVAAGNGGPYYSSGDSPGAARGVITVGASDLDDQITSFSSKGPTLDNRVDPDVVAPGDNIVAPLSPDSIMDIAATYYGFEGGAIPGSGGDYLSLGGTSMATPHVAGAAALLMQAFPNLVNNPHAFRVALMETADELAGYDPNVQGAGRINVSAALSYLDVRNSTVTGGKIPITTILPDAIPIDPWVVKFPGDTLSVNVAFITGKPVDINVTNIGTSSASPFIEIGNSTHQTNGTWQLYVIDLAEIGVNITLPVDIGLGTYSGRIEVLNATDGVSLHNISISFTVELPRGRVYFDRLHNYDFEDSPYYNYLTFIQEMGDYGYDVDVNERLITYESLKNYDILMLPDIELDFTESEISAVHQFVSEGGSLLVLGSYYPFVAGEALNRLLTPYGIQFKTSYAESIVNVEDLGITRLTSADITVTDIDAHPITAGVSSYTLGSGSPLVSSPAQTIARYQNDPVLAIYEHPSGGRVAVFANELAFYYNLIDDLDNLQLAQNTLDWLLVEPSVHVSVVSSSNYNASPVQVEFGIYVSLANRVGVTGLTNGSTINCTVVNDSTTNYVTVSEKGGGVYSGNFSASVAGLYTVYVNVSVSSVLYNGTTSFRAVSSVPEITDFDQQKGGSKPGDLEYPSWVELLELDFYGIDVICRFGEYLVVNGTVNNADNVSIHFTSFPQEYYENTLRNLTYVSANMSIVSSEWNYTLTPTDPQFSAGTYVYIIEARNQTEGINPDAFAVGSAVVVSVEPEVDNDTSKVGGVAIPDMEQYEPLSVPMVQLGLGSSLSLEVVAADEEDSISDMRAFAWVIDISIYYLTGTPFIYQELSLDGTSFTGSLSVPSTGVVTTPSGSYTLQSNWGYVLLLITIDSEGDFDTSEEILFVVSGGGFDSFYMVIMAVMFMVMMVSIMLFQRRAARRRAAAPYGPEMAQYRPPDAPSIPRYCPYCGSPITPGSSFCMECGSSLPTEEVPYEEGAEPEEKDEFG